MVARDEVFRMLNTERVRQEEIWGDLDERNNVGDFICYIQRFLTKAVDTNNPDHLDFVLPNILKLTALGVACLERHWSNEEDYDK